MFERNFLQLADGRRLEYFETGSGADVLLCEAGLGMGAHYWSLLPVFCRPIPV